MKNGQTGLNFDLSIFVTRPGFEPRLAESESDVLPLHYRAIFLNGKFKAIICSDRHFIIYLTNYFFIDVNLL